MISQINEQELLKCAAFFKSLLKLRPQQQQIYSIPDLKNLMKNVLFDEQSPEEFVVKLREVTKSQDKGNLLPFLKRTLPGLRLSIQRGECVELLQALDLDNFTPNTSKVLSNNLQQTASNNSIPMIMANVKGVIGMEIPKVGALGLQMSEAVTIGGIDWQVEMRQYQKEPMQLVVPQQDHAYNDEQELELRLVANNDVRDRLWWCKAYFSIRFKFGNNMGRKQWNEYKQYDFHSYYGCDERLADLKKHWNLKNYTGPLMIAVDVVVKEAILNGPSLATMLLVNKEVLLVNKHLLMAYSPHFNTIFSTPRLPYRVLDVQPEQMQAFKMMIYGVHVFGTSLVDKELLDDELACTILKLATKYQFSVWKHCCEHFLIKNSEKDKMELLELAENENFENLKEHCLANIDPLEYAQNNQRNTVIYARLGKRTQEALNAKLEENAAKMRRSMSNGQGRNAAAKGK